MLPAVVLPLVLSSRARQTDSRDLKPAHRAALAKYLNGHKNCDFLSQSTFEELHGKGEIAYEKKNLGDHMQMPYYFVGDFNRDGREDFALLLSATISGIDQYRIVIWNGTAKGYRVAWEDAQPHDGLFFWSWENKSTRRLAFGAPESDSGFALTPAGGSYIPEH